MSEGKSFEYRGGETERPSEATRQEFFSALEVLGKVLPRSDSPTREYEFENKSIEVGLYDEEELAELEDIRAYDDAKAKKESALPFEAAVRQIKTRVKK